MGFQHTQACGLSLFACHGRKFWAYCKPKHGMLLELQPHRCSNADDHLQGRRRRQCQCVAGWVTECKTQVLELASQTAQSKLLGGRVTRCRLRRRGILPTAIAIAWKASPKSGSSKMARWRRAVSCGSCTAARCRYCSVGHCVCHCSTRTSRVRLAGKASCHESWLACSTGKYKQHQGTK